MMMIDHDGRRRRQEQLETVVAYSTPGEEQAEDTTAPLLDEEPVPTPHVVLVAFEHYYEHHVPRRRR